MCEGVVCVRVLCVCDGAVYVMVLCICDGAVYVYPDGSMITIATTRKIIII